MRIRHKTIPKTYKFVTQNAGKHGKSEGKFWNVLAEQTHINKEKLNFLHLSLQLNISLRILMYVRRITTASSIIIKEVFCLGESMRKMGISSNDTRC